MLDYEELRLDGIKRNLPVLYTIPRWELIIQIRPGSNGVRLINPFNKELFGGNPLSIKKYLNEILGITTQEYYDRWILNITSTSQRPKCRQCNKEAKFIKMSAGYSVTCKSENCDKIDRTKRSIKGLYKRYSDPDETLNSSISQLNRFKDTNERKKLSDGQLRSFRLDPDRIDRLSKGQINRYKDPEQRRLTSEAVKNSYIKYPELRRKQSESHSKRWENPSESMLLTLGKKGNKHKIFSKYESKIISLDSSYELRFFELFSNIKEVTRIIRCPFTIKYNMLDSDIYRTYIPDFLVYLSTGLKYLIEVKPNRYLNDIEVISKRTSAINYCKENEMIYCFVTEDFLFSEDNDINKIIKF